MKLIFKNYTFLVYIFFCESKISSIDNLKKKEYLQMILCKVTYSQNLEHLKSQHKIFHLCKLQL